MNFWTTQQLWGELKRVNAIAKSSINFHRFFHSVVAIEFMPNWNLSMLRLCIAFKTRWCINNALLSAESGFDRDEL